MRKEKKAEVAEKFMKNSEGRAIRTTIFVSEAQDFFLGCVSLETGKPKGEIMREAIEEHLKTLGYTDADRIPKILERLKDQVSPQRSRVGSQQHVGG